ncbi:MAG: CerR family C-terminal domain-containing protein [Novosphingobium sp.]|nr:CerR family C-terminal domain-containing protein [Novosphingobium sp.]
MLQEKILATAISQFGKQGYDGASTRQIAGLCDTAMSSITYHFGGKQGLYLSCADHIAARISERLGDIAAQLQGREAEMDAAQARERLLHLLDAIARLMLDPDSEDWVCFLVREQQNPSEAFDRIYNGVMGNLIESAVLLLARIRPDMPEHERRAQVMLLYGQALVLRAARASVTRGLRAERLGDAETGILRRMIRANAETIFNGGMP